MPVQAVIMRVSPILVLVLGVLPACVAIDQDDLHGTYVAEYAFGSEKLALSEDGTYFQEVTVNRDGRTITQQGRWRYNASDRYIELENGLVLQDGFGSLNANYSQPFKGLVLEKVARPFPWSSIKLGSDEVIRLVKKND